MIYFVSPPHWTLQVLEPGPSSTHPETPGCPRPAEKWKLHKHMKTLFSVVRNLERVTSPVRRGQVTEAGFWEHKAFASFQALPYTTVQCVEAELEDTGLLYKGRARQAGGEYCKRHLGPHRQQIQIGQSLIFSFLITRLSGCLQGMNPLHSAGYGGDWG